jgi:CRISPR-associated protein Cas1
MIIALDAFGASLGKRSNRFLVRTKSGNIDEFSSFQVDEIHLTGPGINVSTAALRLALRRDIMVMIANRDGYPLGFLEPVRGMGRAALRKAQYLVNDATRLLIASRMIMGKCWNQRNHLLLLAKNRKRLPQFEALRSLAEAIAVLCERLEKVESLEGIMACEAGAAKYYWRGISMILPNRFGFEKRVGRGAVDPLNVALNFGYQTYLFRACWREVVRAGLDPHAGILHSDRPGKPSLVLDVMEEFRPLVDRVCVALFTRNRMPARIFDAAGRLTNETCKILLSALHERLKGAYGLDREICDRVSAVRNILLGRTREYIPYRMRW